MFFFGCWLVNDHGTFHKNCMKWVCESMVNRCHQTGDIANKRCDDISLLDNHGIWSRKGDLQQLALSLVDVSIQPCHWVAPLWGPPDQFPVGQGQRQRRKYLLESEEESEETRDQFEKAPCGRDGTTRIDAPNHRGFPARHGGIPRARWMVYTRKSHWNGWLGALF